MEYTEIIYLITNIKEEDDIGNNIASSNASKKVFAKKQSVRTNEYYNAISIGMSPSIEFVIKKLNYNNEEEIKYNNEIYSVIHVVEPKNKYDIVLVCQKKVGI